MKSLIVIFGIVVIGNLIIHDIYQVNLYLDGEKSRWLKTTKFIRGYFLLVFLGLVLLGAYGVNYIKIGGVIGIYVLYFIVDKVSENRLLRGIKRDEGEVK